MKMSPLYEVGSKVQYNSKSCAGMTYGTIVSVTNDIEPHTYTIEPDLFKDKGITDEVEEFHIQRKV